MNPPQIKSYDDDTFRVTMGPPNTDAMENARMYAREMAEEAFTNLDEFPYIYLTSGATEAIDWVLPMHRPQVLENDYRYARLYGRSRPDLHYQSYPFAGTGKFMSVGTDLPVFLDCSYMFASHMQHTRVVPKNVAYIAFSLSKSHNVADYRIGWLMTRAPLRAQHLVQYDYGYGPGRHASVLSCASHYPPNHLYLINRKRLSDAYAERGLLETDTNLFALDQQGNRIPHYQL